MGACLSAPPAQQAAPGGGLPRPPWRAARGVDGAKLHAMRDEFWHTASAYGGDEHVWAAIKAAVAATDGADAAFLEAAGVLPPVPARVDGVGDGTAVTTLWDERGRAYELPAYVLSDPVG